MASKPEEILQVENWEEEEFVTEKATECPIAPHRRLHPGRSQGRGFEAFQTSLAEDEVVLEDEMDEVWRYLSTIYTRI